MKKILIVDDHPETVRLLEVILRGENRRLYRAADGESGLAVARETLPDVILLDIMMPGALDGYDVARRLKKDPETSRCRIIVMTAKTQARDRQQALDSGADDFITKPFDVVDVRNRVKAFLA